MQINGALLVSIAGLCGLLAGCGDSGSDGSTGSTSNGDTSSSSGSTSSSGGPAGCDAGQSRLHLDFVLKATIPGTGPSVTLTPLLGRQMAVTVCLTPQADDDPELTGARARFDAGAGVLEGPDAAVWPQELADQLTNLTGFVWLRDNPTATGISIEIHGAGYPQWKFTADSGVTPKIGLDPAGNQGLAPFAGSALGPSDLRLVRLDAGGYTDGAGGPGAFSFEQ